MIYKVLRITKGFDSEIGGISTIATTWESEEFAKAHTKLVEIIETSETEVIAALKDTDIILVGGVPITRQIMEAAPKCIAVMCQSVGYDPIDVKAATDLNILVINNPSFEWCIEEVSNHAMTLLLACAKKVKILDSLVRQGQWADAKKVQKPMGSIYGQTLGIIGCGAIGRMTARKAQAFGLKVIGYDPYVEKWLAKENGITLMNLTDLIKQSDYVSAHPDLNDTSFHMMGEKEFRQMKRSAYFINTSRGKIVDESALIKALEEKWIAGAGLDVYEVEPLPKDNPLVKMDNVVLLPHSGAYSDASYKQAIINTAQEADRILSGRCPKNVVNKLVKPRVKLVKDT